MNGFFVAFGLAFIGIGVVAIIVGLCFRIPYNNVRRFAGHQVEGEVVDMVWNGAEFNAPRDEAANVEHYKIGEIEMQPGTRHRTADNPPTANMYHKVYRYVVDGKEYLRADGLRYNKGAVQAWIRKKVPVYYNPENPQQSTLSNGKGYKITIIALFSAGGIFTLLGVGSIILSVILSSLFSVM